MLFRLDSDMTHLAISLSFISWLGASRWPLRLCISQEHPGDAAAQTVWRKELVNCGLAAAELGPEKDKYSPVGFSSLPESSLLSRVNWLEVADASCAERGIIRGKLENWLSLDSRTAEWAVECLLWVSFWLKASPVLFTGTVTGLCVGVERCGRGGKPFEERLVIC